jgi:hypothetical protein
MIRKARTGDTVLVKSREMTGGTQTLPWWLGGEGIKRTESTPVDGTNYELYGNKRLKILVQITLQNTPSGNSSE